MADYNIKISAYENVYRTYGWTRVGFAFTKPTFSPIRFLPNNVYELNDKAYFRNSSEPFGLPPYGFGYDFASGDLATGRQFYSLAEMGASTPPATGVTPNILQNVITTSQSVIIGAVNTTSNTINNTLNNVRNSLDTSISNVRNAINTTVTNSSNTVLTRIATLNTAVSNTIAQSTGTIVDKIQSNINQINGLQSSITNEVRSSANSTVNNISQTVNSSTNYLANAVSNSTNNITRNVDNAISNATSNITGQIGAVNSRIATSTQDINKNTNEAIAGVISGISETLNPLNVIAGILGADYQQFIGSFLPNLGGDIGKSIERIRNAINKLLNDEYTSWDEFVMDLGVFRENANLIDGVFNLSLIVPIVLSLFGNAGQIYSQNITKLLMDKVRPTSLQSPDILKGLQRKLISDDTANEMLHKLGFDDDLITILRGNSKIMLDVNEIKNMYLRDMIDEELHDTKLSKLGFKSEDIENLKQLYFPIPVANDLIRFAYREVFTPETVKLYGMDQDFPPEFANYARQVGLDDKWARAYWAAHWELPSPNMAFEMFHRGIIDEAGVKGLLKALDVMPYWREKLVQLSYNPITRVDVRRLYKLGVISLADVEKRYLSIGYSPTDAKLLAKFTEMDNGADEETTAIEIKSLSKSVIETGYKKKVISREQAIASLLDLGYIASDIDIILAIADLSVVNDKVKDVSKEQADKAHKYILDAYKRRSISEDDARAQLLDLDFVSADIDVELSFADYEYQLSIKTNIIQKIQDLFLSNTIDDVELTTYLSVNGFNIKEIEQILNELLVYKGLRDRKPTKADFDKFRKEGIISTEEYIYELQGMGYANKYIQMYLIQIGDIDLGEE